MDGQGSGGGGEAGEVSAASAAVEPLEAVTVAGIPCRHPVWTASGCCNYGRELSALYPLTELGALCVKGTSLRPWTGNPGPRIAETASGMLNAIGLQNPGVEHLLAVDLPWLAGAGATVVVNLVGRTLQEYQEVAARVSAAPAGTVAGLELNISCPNVQEGGLQFGGDPRAAAAVTAAVRAVTPLPLLVKLSPNGANAVEVAEAVAQAGADGLSVMNTLLGLRLDVGRRRPLLANVTGGLSGPAVKPVALRLVWEVSRAVDLPVVGVGGVCTGLDAAEFLLAGASAVQVGTAIFTDPWAPLRIRAELRSWMRAEGVRSVGEIVGAAHPRGG